MRRNSQLLILSYQKKFEHQIRHLGRAFEDNFGPREDENLNEPNSNVQGVEEGGKGWWLWLYIPHSFVDF